MFVYCFKNNDLIFFSSNWTRKVNRLNDSGLSHPLSECCFQDEQGEEWQGDRVIRIYANSCCHWQRLIHHIPGSCKNNTFWLVLLLRIRKCENVFFSHFLPEDCICFDLWSYHVMLLDFQFQFWFTSKTLHKFLHILYFISGISWGLTTCKICAVFHKLFVFITD